MRQDKEYLESLAILGVLLERKTATAADIATTIGISDKTVRKRLAEVNELLSSEGLGSLDVRPKAGVALHVNAAQNEKIRRLIAKNNNGIVTGNPERMAQALQIILRSIKTRPVTVSKVADELFLSAPTAAKELKDCFAWLSGFHITAHSVRNRGIEVKCSETEYRMAVREFVLNLSAQSDPVNSLAYLYPHLNVRLIRDCIADVENEWHFSFTDNSFLEILTQVCIATFENIIGDHSLKLDLNGDDLEQYNEYNFAAKIYSKVNERLQLENRKNEVLYLTIQILCSQVVSLSGDDPSQMVREYDQKLRKFVEQTIAVVSGVINIDLTHDEGLYSGLMNHISALLFRLKYGQPLDATVSSYVRKEFPTTLRVSWLILTLFEDYFHFSISDDELSYIALYIQSAIDSNSRPIHALLVTNQNMGVTRLMHDRIIRNNRQIESLKDVTLHEFVVARWPKMDLILSTADLGISDQRILWLKDPFDEHNPELIESKIAELQTRQSRKKFHFDPVCHGLFEPDLLMANVHYTDKWTLLKEMCARLEKKGYVAKGYLDSVIERENINITSIGGGAAIPHGNMQYTNESKIVVAVLDEPIDWGNEQVSVIFLLNILMKNESELAKWQAFYRQFILLTASKEQMDQMKLFTNPVDLYYYFVQ